MSSNIRPLSLGAALLVGALAGWSVHLHPVSPEPAAYAAGDAKAEGAQAVVRFEVGNPASSAGVLDPRLPPVDTERFMRTQGELMISSGVLAAAIADDAGVRIDLPKWSGRFVGNESLDRTAEVADLRTRVSYQVVPGTYNIDLVVLGLEPKEGKALANRISEAYLAHVQRARATMVNAMLSATTSRVKDFESEIRQLDASCENTLAARSLTSADGPDPIKLEQTRALAEAWVRFRLEEAKRHGAEPAKAEGGASTTPQPGEAGEQARAVAIESELVTRLDQMARAMSEDELARRKIAEFQSARAGRVAQRELWEAEASRLSVLLQMGVHVYPQVRCVQPAR